MSEREKDGSRGMREYTTAPQATMPPWQETWVSGLDVILGDVPSCSNMAIMGAVGTEKALIELRVLMEGTSRVEHRLLTPPADSAIPLAVGIAS